MTTQPVDTARVLARRGHRVSRSAGDVEFVAHVDDPVRRPRGADRRVVPGPGTDLAGQRDVVLGFRFPSLPPGTAADPGVPAGPGILVR
jgi:hypothetical protein